MDQTQKFLIGTLRSYFLNDAAPDASAVEWAPFFQLCKAHEIGGIVYASLKKSEANVPLTVKNDLRNSFLFSIGYAERQKYEYELIKNTLAESGIRFIPFKGLTLQMLYPDPELRTMGDMDILVSDADRPECHKILKGMGYRRLAHKNEWLYEKNQIKFEIHNRVKHAFETGANCWDFDFLWDHAVIKADGYWGQLDPAYHLALLLDHMAMHAIDNGFGIRMMTDIVMLYSRCQIDIDDIALSEVLKDLKILEFSKRIFALCESLFRCKTPFAGYEANCDVVKELGDYIMSGGVFGKNLDLLTSVDNDLAKKYIMNHAAIIGKIQLSCSHIFPPHDFLLKEYPTLQRKPYLLPAVWLQRGLNITKNRPLEVLRFLKRLIFDKNSKKRVSMLRQFGL